MRDRKAILPLDAAQSSVVRRDLRIGDILAAEGKLDRTGIEQVIKLQESRGLRFGEAALRLRLITPEDLRSALAKQYDFPYVPLDGDAFGADLAASRVPPARGAAGRRPPPQSAGAAAAAGAGDVPGTRAPRTRRDPDRYAAGQGERRRAERRLQCRQRARARPREPHAYRRCRPVGAGLP